MRFIFKTDYNQDVKLAKHGGHVFWYSLLGLFLVAAPWMVPEYWLAQLTFVLIYGIVGLGLMLLAGFTGLFSMGHAAFLGVGAYTQAVCTQAGMSFVPALICATGLSAAVGVLVGLPALRIKGIYLGIATLSFGFIVEEVLARWESVTGGNAGIHLKAPNLWVHAVNSAAALDDVMAREAIDLYVLDLNLPGLDGYGVLSHLRSRPATVGVPVIVLTAKGDDVDRIVGLEVGADDYLGKPFNPRELLARIHAVLRRRPTLRSCFHRPAPSRASPARPGG